MTFLIGNALLGSATTPSTESEIRKRIAVLEQEKRLHEAGGFKGLLGASADENTQMSAFCSKEIANLKEKLTPSTIEFGRGYRFRSDLNIADPKVVPQEQFLKDCGRVHFTIARTFTKDELPPNSEEKEVSEAQKNRFLSLVNCAILSAIGKEKTPLALYWATQMLFGEVMQFIGKPSPDNPESMVTQNSDKAPTITIKPRMGAVVVSGTSYLRARSLDPSISNQDICFDAQITVRKSGETTGFYAFSPDDGAGSA